MQILRVLSLAAAVGLSPWQREVGPEVVAVRRVIDAQTIDVTTYGRVRLAGIRATSRDARQRLEGIVALRFVRLEFASAVTRGSAYVLLEDGTFVNALLVREGLARVIGHPPGARGKELLRSARQSKRPSAISHASI